MQALAIPLGADELFLLAKSKKGVHKERRVFMDPFVHPFAALIRNRKGTEKVKWIQLWSEVLHPIPIGSVIATVHQSAELRVIRNVVAEKRPILSRASRTDAVVLEEVAGIVYG